METTPVEQLAPRTVFCILNNEVKTDQLNDIEKRGTIPAPLACVCN